MDPNGQVYFDREELVENEDKRRYDEAMLALDRAQMREEIEQRIRDQRQHPWERHGDYDG